MPDTPVCETARKIVNRLTLRSAGRHQLTFFSFSLEIKKRERKLFRGFFRANRLPCLDVNTVLFVCVFFSEILG